MVGFQRCDKSPLLAHRMNKLIVSLGSSVLGLVVSLAFVWLPRTLGVSVTFPSPGGEDDFSLRILWFLFFVCPALMAIGAWIGYTSFANVRRWLSMWAGVLVGTAFVFGAARLLRGQIAMLSGDGSANYGVLGFYVSWVVASSVGALAARRLDSNPRPSV